MSACNKKGDFYKYFKENMDSLGLPSPVGWFGSFTTAIATAGGIMEALDKYGSKMPVREMRATNRLERVKLVAPLIAAGYAGAVIGSIAVAVGRVNGCGARISDVMFLISKYELKFPDFHSFFQRYPEVYNGTAKVIGNRSHFNRMARRK